MEVDHRLFIIYYKGAFSKVVCLLLLGYSKGMTDLISKLNTDSSFIEFLWISRASFGGWSETMFPQWKFALYESARMWSHVHCRTWVLGVPTHYQWWSPNIERKARARQNNKISPKINKIEMKFCLWQTIVQNDFEIVTMMNHQNTHPT